MIGWMYNYSKIGIRTSQSTASFTAAVHFNVSMADAEAGMTSFLQLMAEWLSGTRECQPMERLAPLLAHLPDIPKVSGRELDPLLCGVCSNLVYEPISLLNGQSICKLCYCKTLKSTCEVEYSVNVCLAGILERHTGGVYKAMELRVEGNAKVKEKKWEEAVSIYSRTLDLMGSGMGKHVVLSNRCFAEVSSGMLEEALRDANSCLKKAPFWKKGYYRKSAVLEKMGLNEEALVLCLMVAKCGTLDASVADSISRLSKQLVEVSAVEGVSERMWLHVCVERERAARAGEVIKWQGTQVSGLTADEVECSLCCRLFYRPATTPCGHTLCEPCLNRCLDHSTTCPVCRFPLTVMLGKYQHKACVAMDSILKQCLPHECKLRESEHQGEQSSPGNLSCLLSQDICPDTFELSIFVCSLAFPFVKCGLHVFEPRYRLMVRQAWESESKCFGMCAPNADTYSEFGTVLKIYSHQLLQDGRVLIDTRGLRRFRVVSRDTRDGNVVARVRLLCDTNRMVDALIPQMQHTYRHLAQGPPFLSDQLGGLPDFWEGAGGPDGPGWIWYGLAMISFLKGGSGVTLEVLGDLCVASRYSLMASVFN